MERAYWTPKEKKVLEFDGKNIKDDTGKKLATI